VAAERPILTPEGVDIATPTFAARTDVGRHREHNEDNYLVDKRLRLFVVCDGMGGHAAGEVASAIAVRTLSEEVRRAEDLLKDYLAEETGSRRVSKQDITNMLSFAVNIASRKIHQAALLDPGRRGMGTTLAGVLFVGHQAFVLHVGDSRVYLLRNRSLEQLTEDHNVLNELIKKNKLDGRGVEARAPKHAITRAVGVYEHCEPEVLVLDLADGDRFLLCSDGLSSYFEPPEGSLEQLADTMSEPDLETAVDGLIRVANLRGGKDNITAVLVALHFDGGSARLRAERLEQQRRVLSRTALFDSLTSREVRRVLQSMESMPFDAGALLSREGTPSENLYVLLSGQVEMSRAGAPSVRLGMGHHFGEVSLLRQKAPAATVKALEAGEVLVMPRDGFLEIVRREHRLAVKLLWRLAGVLSDRLDALAATTRPASLVPEDDIPCDIEEDSQSPL
jgi:PPM family protein phosphatase